MKLKVIYFKSFFAFFALAAIACNAAPTDPKKTKEQEQAKPADFSEVTYDWTRTFAEVLQKVDEKHYKISGAQDCFVKAIDGFLNCLDPHSTFMDPKSYKSILEATSGEFFGIGIVIDNTRSSKDKFLLVIDTVPAGPADTAGVKPLDKIIEIDGKPLEGMSTEEATAMLKGERSTKVHIKVMRENSPDLLSFDIARDVIKEQSSLCFYLPEQNVYYLALTIFSENAAKQIKELLEKSRKKQYRALILDLRNNSGGLLNSGVDIAGLFLDKGSLVVVTKDKNNKELERYETHDNPVANDQLPIFILINNYTASAGEILAGCLKIHSQNLASKANNKPQRKLMTFLVGTKTFGKGSVQEVIPVGSNCAMKITTSLYFLPNDISIQGVGIEPDFAVEKRFPPTNQMTWFTKYYGREQALEHHITVHKEEEQAEKKKDSTKETWADRARDMLEKDNQFREALTLINLLHAARTSCPANVSDREKAVKYMKSIYVSSEEPLKMEELKLTN